jgi:hypothetical protein
MNSPTKKPTTLHKFAPASELGPAEDYPVGSVAWAERISNRLQIGAVSVNRHTVHHLWNTIKAIWSVEPHPWEIWPEGHPFGTPDDYCRAVTGHSWEFLINVVVEFADDPEITTEAMRAGLAKAQAEHRSQGTRTDQHHADGMRLTQGSNQTAYLLRRLARDHVEVLERYERGEFPSVRAAAIEAGVIRNLTIFERIRDALAKHKSEFNAEELTELRSLLE